MQRLVQGPHTQQENSSKPLLTERDDNDDEDEIFMRVSESYVAG